MGGGTSGEANALAGLEGFWMIARQINIIYISTGNYLNYNRKLFISTGNKDYLYFLSGHLQIRLGKRSPLIIPLCLKRDQIKHNGAPLFVKPSDRLSLAPFW